MAALTTLIVAPGVHLLQAATSSAGASSKVRWGMLIDTNQCTPGCDACVSACRKENALPEHPGTTGSQWIRKIEIKEVRTGKQHSVPMMCQHCEQPPCVDVCPTGASFKRADGIVLVDKHICIGCRYCIMACPYKARSFVHDNVSGQNPDVPRGKGTVEACNLCVHRIDNGEQPACVQACAAEAKGAIVFGDMNDPNSDISKRLATYTSRQIRADLQLNTGVRYSGV
jgi:molybdopterin-containing oxidoreductase family iron-sulfur binding subunit